MKIKFGSSVFRQKQTAKKPTITYEGKEVDLLEIADAWMICDGKIEKEEDEEGYFDDLVECMMKKTGYSRKKIVDLMKYMRPMKELEVIVQ